VYSLTVERDGYNPWTLGNVRVAESSDRCGWPDAVTVDAYLVPLPSRVVEP
jgi:hypothetical protein